MIRHAYLRLRLTSPISLVALVACGALACATPSSSGSGSGGDNGSSGGSNGSGGNHASGGSNGSGGSSSSGSGGSSNGSGGSSSSGSGGSSAKGGSNGSGGSNVSTGGSNGSGGSSSSGGSGGSNGTGGSSSTGGTTGAGGTTGNGGSTSTGGTTGTGGSGSTGTGGATGAGGSSTASDPPGYYKTADWSVTSVDWHGCVWTGKDSTVSGSTTSITPQDFTAATTEGGPYEVSGTVYNDYNAVALLGFNINEAVTGSSTQCKYNAAASTQNGPPAGTIPSSATGIAVNWSAKVAPPTSFRIQLQAADGATNSKDVYCATITDATGPSFIPFTSFYQQCWYVGTTTSPGAQFSPSTNSVDAIAFEVPGTVAEKAPFDFTITGFAPGTSAKDAPGGAAACGTLTGTIGSTTASQDASFQRAAVTGTDCHKYIVQNNNWGNPTGSDQVVNYSGTGFTVQASSGSGSSAPASFPSTYVGANGNIANGTYNTWADTGLPKQISSIGTAMTSFGWSGGASSGQFNATYDVWFAKSDPTSDAGMYNDGISGFIMVWLREPSNFHPIGTKVRTATIADSSGTSHTWDVWAGPRGSGQGSTGGVNDGAGRPVISYVIEGSALPSLSFDLKLFMNDAVKNADTENGITQAFASSWYLTDVFAGFEIWNGSDATNLKSTGFSIAVK